MQNQTQWFKLHSDFKHQPKYPSSDLVRFVFKNFPRGGKILDLGCGAGRHLKFLAENGFETYGVDYSQNGLKASEILLSQHSLKAELSLASADDLPFEDEFFDGVLCYGILYYNPKDLILKAAKEIFRVLKKGSKAYVLVRTTKDSRYEMGEKISAYESIVRTDDPKNSAFSENGMRMYFFDEGLVKEVFKDFKITINHIRMDFENYSFADDDFALVLEK